MNFKDFIYPLLFIFVIIVIFNTTRLNRNISEKNGILKDLPNNHKELLPKNGFVKPKHTLLNLLNDISSSDKIYLLNIVEKVSFTSKTISRDLSDLVNHIMKKVINGINGISELDLFTKDIEQIYVIKDNDNNIRLIIDTFAYDIKNHYTIRINLDIVVFKGEVYLNMLDIDESAINNILNNYDVKYQSQGILSKYNMFINDMESLLNSHYKNNGYNVIGVKETSLDFDSTMLSGVFTLDQLWRNYLPSGTPNKEASYMCKKNKDSFDHFGVNFINDINSECQIHNRSLQKYPNTPYDAPGVVTKRVDFNQYDWLKNPIASGNILYGQGFHL
tara:strand:- start:496 stop:1491 length:996 start_codon:yes stop_codon:yes gene_type:complete